VVHHISNNTLIVDHQTGTRLHAYSRCTTQTVTL